MSKWRFAVVVVAQYCLALLLLRHAYPVYFDGGGPMPSFFQHSPLPTLSEYHAHQWRYDLDYLVPYCIAALVIVALTLLAAPRLSNKAGSRPRIAAVSFALMLAAAIVSDVLAIAGLHSSRFFALTTDVAFRLLLVAVPLAATSAVFARSWR